MIMKTSQVFVCRRYEDYERERERDEEEEEVKDLGIRQPWGSQSNPIVYYLFIFQFDLPCKSVRILRFLYE
jgi:hypothetical protein